MRKASEVPVGMRVWRVVEMILWTIMLMTIIHVLQPLNDEQIIENWTIGLLGMLVFAGFYIMPSDKVCFRKFRRLHFFFLAFFFSWFLADMIDWGNITLALIASEL